VSAPSPCADAPPQVEDLLSLFPDGAGLDDDGMLRVGGCRVDDLAAAYGTPTLVVDEPSLRARARAYREELAARWPCSRVVFASKAFPATAVQRVMLAEGVGLDVAGGGELRSALAAGADPAALVLHGNAKSTDELELAVQVGVGLVVVDGPDDVDRLEQLVPAVAPAGYQQPVLVRVIPGVVADTHAHVLTGHEGSKFGLLPTDAAPLIRRIAASPRLRMDGLHVHVGSQIMDAQPFADSVAPLARLGTFDVYDLGGGLGARYTFADHPASLPTYLDALVKAAREHLPSAAELIVEPGRSMVAHAGVTVYRVVTVKRSGKHTFVAVDGGMGDNLEVALFAQRFEAAVASRVGGGSPVTLVGRHCESGDVLIDPVSLPHPARDDLVVVPVTGAYCFTMANTYNGARRIPVAFVGEGRHRLVVRRDTWEDLLARDVPAAAAT
jgi:diaminopimelate decarboxylase